MNNNAFIPPELRYKAKRFCDIMLEISGADPSQERKFRPVVMARVMVAYALLLDGYTENAIGNVLGWDHSTINHYRGKMNDILSSPGYEAERELWEKFRERI